MSEEPRTPDLTGEGGLRRGRETAYRFAFLACAALSVLTTIGIVGVLLVDALEFFSEVPVGEFLIGIHWVPSRGEFGVLPLVVGTVMVTVGSAVIALPLGVLTAIYLSEYAAGRTRAVLKPLLEVLAGVPTIVYGYFALVYITPALNVLFTGLNDAFGLSLPTLGLFNALSASIVVGILIIPMVASISEDAMSAVPDELRQAGYGLGATKFEVSTTIVVPAAVSGIASSFILAISRAIGETMAVTLASGSSPVDYPAVERVAGVPYVPPADLIAMYADGAQTMTAAIIEIASGDLSGGSTAYKSLFAIGLTLFAITLAMNVVSDVVSSRYREVYE